MDIEKNRFFESDYNIAFFSSGYEKRCTHIPKYVNKNKIKQTFVLGFKENRDDSQRLENDKYFTNEWSEPIIISSEDESKLYEYLRKVDFNNKDSVKILVDYSAMSRLWYTGILNWVRYITDIKELEIDFLYSVGEYKNKIPPMAIKDILSVPGCEGGYISPYKSVSIFGLGFDGLATLCVLDLLEPDIIYTYLALPAAFKDYPPKAREYNREIIKQSASILELPIFSVESTYSHLAELIISHISDANISIIPMGPKPHILASILLSIRFQDLICLRVSGVRSNYERVGTTGQIVYTKVQFKS